MRFFNFPLARLTLCLIAGILSGGSKFYFAVTLLIIFFLIAATLSWHNSRKRLIRRPLFEVSVYVLFFLIGFLNVAGKDFRINSQHYGHQIKYGAIQKFRLIVKERLRPDNFYEKYIAEVTEVDTRKSEGSLLLMVKKSPDSSALATTTVLEILGEIKEIPPPLNPGQFDYRQYMLHQSVNFRISIENSNIVSQAKGSMTLSGYAAKLRSNLISKLDETDISKKEKQLIQALVLGEKREIDRQLYKDYASAGAVHMLAVSGLHVGIIYIILQFLLRPLLIVNHGRKIQIILLVIALWSYALITGLSASVCRSVCMFSCFALANILNRPTNSLNTCLLSMFILLLINPYWLFHVGFQLSYLAVCCILIIHPWMNKLYHPKWKVDKLFWNILTVSLAAQIGVTPLSLYYFHQFPGLFLLTNLTLLPLLGSIITLGLILFASLIFGYRIIWFEYYYGKTLGLMNNYVRWIAEQDSWIFKDIPFNEFNLIGSYLVLILLMFLPGQFPSRQIRLLLTGCIIILLSMNINLFNQYDEELIVFQKSRATIIGYRKFRQLTLYSFDPDTNQRPRYPVNSYLLSRQIEDLNHEPISNYLSFNDIELLIIDSSGVYTDDVDGPVVLLIGSPKINLDRMLGRLRPSLLIADGSNHAYLVRRWRKTAEIRKLPFHHTGTKGAYVLEQ